MLTTSHHNTILINLCFLQTRVPLSSWRSTWWLRRASFKVKAIQAQPRRFTVLSTQYSLNFKCFIVFQSKHIFTWYVTSFIFHFFWILLQIELQFEITLLWCYVTGDRAFIVYLFLYRVIAGQNRPDYFWFKLRLRIETQCLIMMVRRLKLAKFVSCL